MYAIEVASNAFKDLSIVKQHKLVKDVIAVRSSCQACTRSSPHGRQTAQ